MGILNVTPDSFSDGGLHAGVPAALAHARRMLEAGADIIDIGGESTRPGAAEVSIPEELSRVVPVVRALRREFPGACLSVDTRHAEVARAALEEGADILNDIILNYRSLGTVMKIKTCTTHIFNCAVFKSEVFCVGYIDSCRGSEDTELVCLEDAEVSIHTCLNINKTLFFS